MEEIKWDDKTWKIHKDSVKDVERKKEIKARRLLRNKKKKEEILKQKEEILKQRKVLVSRYGEDYKTKNITSITEQKFIPINPRLLKRYKKKSNYDKLISLLERVQPDLWIKDIYCREYRYLLPKYEIIFIKSIYGTKVKIKDIYNGIPNLELRAILRIETQLKHML